MKTRHRKFFRRPRQLVPSTLRGHLRSNGVPKRQYTSAEAAAKAAARHHKQSYVCDVCSWWHIGGDS